MAPASGPVRVSLEAPPLVEAGVASLLSSHPERVTLLPHRCGVTPEVEIFDVSGRPAAAHAARTAGIPLVAISHLGDADSTARALAFGAVRVLTLDVSADDLLTTLEDVRLVDVPPRRVRDNDALSAREAEILHGICRGLSNNEIAAELFLSINSVKSYIRSAYRKIGVSRRSQAVLWGVEHGYDLW